ncbi:MAG: DUF4430 domain-containing protein [Oscillospiraceae bacterium]|nr:DUF4430 domain-containing protein [Oscillospiraceae bacterium]
MMKSSMKKLLSFILCAVLIAAMALFATGCKATAPDDYGDTNVITGGETLGEGSRQFTFTVVDVNGKEVSATIKTDEKIVGDALMALDLLAGEEGPYGLYVKTVNSMTYEYEKDGKYWSFYVNGEYAVTGVDMTEIVDGATYTMKVE